MTKTLETDSVLNNADVNGDNVVSNDELARHERMLKIENEDKKEDQIRSMAWFALAGMLLYPFAVVIADFVELDNAAKILGDMAPTYFVSVAALVAAFFGAQAYTKGK